MLVTDGKGSIKKIWGPYSPKTYDGDFLKCHQSELSNVIKGCNVVADCHFAYARPQGTIGNVRFLAPYARICARVESPFGLIKQRFKSLKGPFWEDDKQLHRLIYFAAAIENRIAKQ